MLSLQPKGLNQDIKEESNPRLSAPKHREATTVVHSPTASSVETLKN